MNARYLIAAASIFLASCAAPPKQPAQPADRTDEKPAATAPPASPLDPAVVEAVDRLIAPMSAEKIEDRQESQLAFERMCHQAGRPGAEDERAALCRVIAARIGAATPKPARVWMLRKLETISGPESVEALAACLKDGDVEVRDAARRALAANPSGEALTVLAGALQTSETDADRIAYIQALAYRDIVPFAVLEPFARSGSDAVKIAALDAISRDSTRVAFAPMIEGFVDGTAPVRRAAGTTILRYIDALRSAGDIAMVRNAAKFLSTAPTTPLQRLALLRANLQIEGAQATHDVIRFMNSGNPHDQRIAAAGILDEFRDTAITEILCQAVPKVKPETQVMLLDVLSRRLDALAVVPALVAVESDDAAVRVAALRVIGAVGFDAHVAMLAARAAGEEREEAETARKALAELRDSSVDTEIVARLDSSSPAVRVELIRALAARGAKDGVAVFLKQTAAEEAEVRIAAFEALSRRAEPRDVPELLAALLRTSDGAIREAAESAVVAACQKITDKEERAAEVLKQMASAADADLASYIRMLGRLEGRAALQTIRATAEEDPPTNAAAHEAAIRALCSWSSPEVMGDLARIGRETESSTHRTLAIRGFSRLARAATDLSAAQRFEMMRGLMERAATGEEYKLMLAALGTARVAEALPLAERYLASPETANEAATAMIAIVKGTPTISATSAQTSIRGLLEKELSESVKKSAETALKTIDEFRGYLRDWQLCGPYAVKGKRGDDLADIALPPEGAEPVADMTGPAKAEWRPVTTFREDNPWIVNLRAIDGGTDRCIYARTTLVSNAERKVRLDIGSDDGIVVWLNGERVHAKAGTRGLTVGEDKLDVALKAGENVLLLKVLQGNGEWGFCVGVRTPEGEPLELGAAAGEE
ncbi:MAG: hypothetical protein AMXMBFR47_20780 [Planctomycetota bacterium]